MPMNLSGGLRKRKEGSMNKRTGRLGQTRVYIGKFWRIFLNEKGWKVLIFAIVIAAMLGLVMGEDMYKDKEFTRTGLFAVVCSLLWIGIFNSIQNVCREREIIKREHRTGLHITSYVGAHVIFQAGICAVQALLTLVVYFFLMDFPSAGAVTGNFYIDMFFCFFLILFAADMMGLMVSSIVRNTTTAMTVLPFLLIIQLILGGTVFPLAGPAKKLSALTISKWGQRILTVEANLNEIPSNVLAEELDQLRMFDGMDTLIDLVPDDSLSDMSAQMTYKKIYEFKAENVTKRWLYLLEFSAVFILISIISLEFVDKDKR